MTRAGRQIALLAAILFVGGFTGTVATRTQSQPARPDTAPVEVPLIEWLNLDAGQAAAVSEHDPRFAEDLERLRRELAEERGVLIAMFENVDTGDEALRQQIEAVIDVHNRLERRVADYLLSVRHLLTPQQQQRLFNLCAENIRDKAQRHRWRHGWQEAEPAGADAEGEGQRGQGEGRRWRGGNGQGRGPGGRPQQEAARPGE